MATKKVKDKEGLWHDINDARLPSGLGTADQVAAVNASGDGMIWTAPNDPNKIDKRYPITEQISYDDNTSFVPINDNPTEGTYVYGLTEFGQKVVIGRLTQPEYYPVGGIIGHIYEEGRSEGYYTFYDINGNLMKKVGLGDRPAFYSNLHTEGKPKYLIMYDGEKLGADYTWTILDKDGNPIYLDFKGMDLDDGQYNTNRVFTEFPELTYQTQTIWHKVKMMNEKRANGCDDWFVPASSQVLYPGINDLTITRELFNYEPFISSSSTKPDAAGYLKKLTGMYWNKKLETPGFDRGYFDKGRKGVLIPMRWI